MSILRRYPYKPRQEGAPQDTAEMPSTGNSPPHTSAERGTGETSGGSQDVERSGMAGEGKKRTPEPR